MFAPLSCFCSLYCHTSPLLSLSSCSTARSSHPRLTTAVLLMPNFVNNWDLIFSATGVFLCSIFSNKQVFRGYLSTTKLPIQKKTICSSLVPRMVCELDEGVSMGVFSSAWGINSSFLTHPSVSGMREFIQKCTKPLSSLWQWGKVSLSHPAFIGIWAIPYIPVDTPLHVLMRENGKIPPQGWTYWPDNPWICTTTMVPTVQAWPYVPDPALKLHLKPSYLKLRNAGY